MAARKAELEDAPALSQAFSSNPHNELKIQVLLVDLQRRKIRAQKGAATFPRPYTQQTKRDTWFKWVFVHL